MRNDSPEQWEKVGLVPLYAVPAAPGSAADEKARCLAGLMPAAPGQSRGLFSLNKSCELDLLSSIANYLYLECNPEDQTLGNMAEMVEMERGYLDSPLSPLSALFVELEKGVVFDSDKNEWKPSGSTPQPDHPAIVRWRSYRSHSDFAREGATECAHDTLSLLVRALPSESRVF